MDDVKWSHDEDRLLAAEITEVGVEDDGPGVPHAWKAIIVGGGDGDYEDDLVGMHGTLEFNSAYALDGGVVSAGTKVYLRVRGWWSGKGVIFDIAGFLSPCDHNGDGGSGGGNDSGDGDGYGDGNESGEGPCYVSFYWYYSDVSPSYAWFRPYRSAPYSTCPDYAVAKVWFRSQLIFGTPYLVYNLTKEEYQNGKELLPPVCLSYSVYIVIAAPSYWGAPAPVPRFIPRKSSSECFGCDPPSSPVAPGVPGLIDPIDQPGQPGIPGDPQIPGPVGPPVPGIPGEPGIPWLPPRDPGFPVGPDLPFPPVGPMLPPPGVPGGPVGPPASGLPGFFTPRPPSRPGTAIIDECSIWADSVCGAPGTPEHNPQCWHDVFLACVLGRQRLVRRLPRVMPRPGRGGSFRPSSSGGSILLSGNDSYVNVSSSDSGDVSFWHPSQSSRGLELDDWPDRGMTMEVTAGFVYSDPYYYGRSGFHDRYYSSPRTVVFSPLFESSVDPMLYEVFESLAGSGGSGWWTLGVESITLSSTPIHDWSPPPAYLYLLNNTTMGPVTITGLSVGQVDGQEVWIKNVSASQNIILSWESSSSSSGNRFSNSPAIGSDVILPGGRVFYQYSTVVNRWVKIV